MTNYDQGGTQKLVNCITDNAFVSKKDWNFPKESEVWHITTLYRGNEKLSKFTSNPAYSEFSEGKVQEIKFDGFVYVLDNLMFAYTLNKTDYYCNNDIPHLTLLLRKDTYLQPKHSNVALSQIFKKNTKPIKQACYLEIMIDGYPYFAYIQPFSSPVQFSGRMTSFFS